MNKIKLPWPHLLMFAIWAFAYFTNFEELRALGQFLVVVFGLVFIVSSLFLVFLMLLFVHMKENEEVKKIAARINTLWNNGRTYRYIGKCAFLLSVIMILMNLYVGTALWYTISFGIMVLAIATTKSLAKNCI